MKTIPRNCGPTRCAVHDGLPTTVVVEMSMLHDGVNMPVSVDARITVDTTVVVCMSTGIMFKLFFFVN